MATYVRSHPISPPGFSERQLDDTHYEVIGTGTEATSPTRIEKIATARAAEIGKDERLKFFKVENVRFAAKCAEARQIYKGTSTVASYYPQVILTVVYSKSPLAGFQPSAETFDRLSDELSHEPAAGPTGSAAPAAPAMPACAT